MSGSSEVWKQPSIVGAYLVGVRGGIPFAAEQIQLLIRIIEALREPVRRFADLGCGSGILAAAILTKFPQAAATLVDFSEPMIEEAKTQLQNYGSQAHFVIADLGDPGWARAVADRAPFDVIVSGYAIHHQPDERKRQLYKEIFGLLDPGGLFLNMEHVSSPTPRVESLSDDLFIDSLHRFHAARGAEKSREQVAAEFVHRPDRAANILAPVEGQCGWLRECGFEDVDCYFKVFELAIFGGRRPKAHYLQAI